MPPEKVYLCMMGRSNWALINTYYAVLGETGFRPDEIFVVVEQPFSGSFEVVRDGLSILSESFGFTPVLERVDVAEADIVDAVRKITAVIREKKVKGAEIAIDITAGRKAVVAGTLLPIHLTDVDYVFYLSVRVVEDIAKPYMMIPRQFHELHEFKEESVRAWHGE